MICPNCGKDVPDGNFCEECGSSLHIGKETKVKQAKTKKTGEGFSKKGKTIIGILILVLCISTGFFYIQGSKFSTAEKTAEQYRRYYNNRQWDKIYDMTNITGTEFITKASYEKVMEDVTGELGEINSSNDTDSVEKQVYFGSDYYCSFQKLNKKRYFFFDQWELAGLKVDTVQIEIPYIKQCPVSIDGTKIKDIYLKEEEDQKYYSIEVLEGNHTVTYEDKNGFLSKDTYELNTDSLNGLSLKYSDTQVQAAKNTMVKFLKDWAGYLGKQSVSADEIQDYFYSREDAESFIAYYTVSGGTKNSKADIVTQPKTGDIIESPSRSFKDPYISFNASCEYTYTNDFWGQSAKDTFSIDEDFYMVYADGTWKIAV
ncbi:zinc ribbon domain-containing protein [Anaerostipes sp.]|uniref:zinc ribbon domain-containing protein n=1 Tax=Anaerostipes sp. TaxID=1872530 RepID=UPI0025C67F75|nr:zinc ribbon domain-containing protein [Anaerostipes sp.]MBS7009218.1 hypothetical protein [Anaerostipes sp.]